MQKNKLIRIVLFVLLSLLASSLTSITWVMVFNFYGDMAPALPLEETGAWISGEYCAGKAKGMFAALLAMGTIGVYGIVAAICNRKAKKV